MLLYFMRSRRLTGLGLVALACALSSLPAQAQWKWLDSRGQTHISDTPPPRDVPDKDVLQRPDPTARKAVPAPAAAAPSAASTSARPAVDPELEERKRKAEQDQATRQKADDKKAQTARADNCQRAREQLSTMESGMRVVRVRPDGEREYLSDEQRASEAQRARSTMATECR